MRLIREGICPYSGVIVQDSATSMNEIDAVDHHRCASLFPVVVLDLMRTADGRLNPNERRVKMRHAVTSLSYLYK